MFSKNIRVKTQVIIITVMLCCSNAFAETKVGIIIPELRAPFKIIFDAVADGVDQGLNQRTAKLVLKKDYESNEIIRWTQKENIDAVITLGGLGRKASLYIPNSTPIVLGALLSAPSDSINNFPGIALTPDPGALFKMLNRLDNKRNKVVVVYNPTKNQWLVDLAKRQAASNGVQLVAYEATGIKQAAIIYDEIFSSSNLDNTALWLLQDRKVVDSKVVLPFILEKAWQKEIVVFSSALSHVKKGVLFCMYPDNTLHGEQLARLIKDVSAGKYDASANNERNVIYPSKGLQDAINIRTAEHLGLNISRSELREYDVVFPVSN